MKVPNTSLPEREGLSYRKFFPLLIFLVIATGSLVYYFAPKKISLQVLPWDLKDQTQFSCSTIAGVTLFPRPNFKEHTFEKLDGSLFIKDKTKMAVEIDDKILKLITATSVEAGMMEPAEFLIIREDESTLIAVDPEEEILIDKGVNTFVLNKKSGLAVWSKSKPSFFTNELPDGQMYYMECR